ncbi:MAG TPA: TrmH family RNA methyltransferase [Candidatus Microsaccharimonas sp.]|nr:TrmH family RNA methyltransferase [Candidatus Microsaccharimonas sp.]
MRNIILIAHNLRSTHNIGSLLRTAEGLGVSKLYMTGYTPYPLAPNDDRLPHIARKLDQQIHKTALDAETLIPWQHEADVFKTIADLQSDGFSIVAVEQSATSVPLATFQVPDKIALLVGREVEGVEPEVLELCDTSVEIPMFGKKESFNVVQAAAMALYHCRFS